MRRRPVSVVEFAAYSRRADQLLTEAERSAVADLLAFEPTSGDLIPGTGGLRKVRIAVGGSGKRGGGRVIYYFHSDDFPLLLLALYAKNEKSDLSARDRKTYTALIEEIVRAWRRK